MKKYLQYNNPHYRDVGATQSQIPPVRDPSSTEGSNTNNKGVGIIDLSGKLGPDSVTMVTGQAWTEPEHEQEAALDLSKSRFELQEEALDLSKPGTSRPDRPNSQSYQPTHPVNQSHRLVHTPPASRQTRSPAGQPYSLLQAALNSHQPSTRIHNLFDKPSALLAMLDQRVAHFQPTGTSIVDYSRTIKPFTTMSSRPLGITVPQMSHPSGAIIQGTHKPIAITTPQPHNSSVTTKSENTSVNSVNASQSISSTSNHGYLISQANYSSGGHSQISHQLNSAKLNSTDGGKLFESLKDPVGGMVERYLIQPPEGLNRLVGNVHVIPTEALAGFACKQCSKTFKTKAALKLHTTVHKTPEERQYACTVCGRRFLHRHHLVVHQRKHSGEKPFKCDACSKTFMAIFLLHKHLRKHTRETGPVSHIALNQLKQLHDKKLITENANALGRLSTGSKPFDSESVIVLDDDEDDNISVEVTKVKADESGKLDRKRYERTKAGNILDMFENDPNLIIEKIKADLQRQQEANKNKNDAKKSVAVEKESGDTEKNIKEKQVSETKLVSIKTEQNLESNTETEIKRTTDNVNMTVTVDKVTDASTGNSVEIKQEQIEESMPELTPENVEKTVAAEEVYHFPEYGSDDEVELDPVTGDLRVLGKKEVDTEEVGSEEVGTEEVDKEEVELEMKEEYNYTLETEMTLEDDVRKFGNEENNTAESVEVESQNIEPHKNDVDNTESNYFEESKKEPEEAVVEHNVEISEEILVPSKDAETALNVDLETFKEQPTADTEQKDHLRESQDKETEKKANDNIFEKLTEIKSDSKEKPMVKQKQHDQDDKVDKEVAVILSIIKQKLCEKEDGPSKAKKAKLEGKTSVQKTDSRQPVVLVSDINRGKVDNDAAFLTYEPGKKSRAGGGRRGKKKGKKVKCEICGRSFHSNHYLLLHMAVHKRNPMLQSLKKAKDYQMKALGFINKANVTCEICNKVFKFQKSLNSHMRVHSEKMIQTKLYRKAFRDFMAEAVPPGSRSLERSQSQLVDSESHSRSVNESPTSKETRQDIPAVKKIRCDSEDCNILKEDEYDDPPIKVIIGEDNIKRYCCHACDNTYTTKQKLRMHALIHKDNCFLCDICGKSFFRHITLDKHLSTHKLPRPHVCTLCKKTFIHKSSLMRHRVIHDKSNATNVRQNPSDVNFEMKMLDTYTMLRQERINKLNGQQTFEVPRADQVNFQGRGKCDPLDLSVRIKTDDCLPPVLSPVSYQTATQANPWNLSPPLITQETSSKSSEKSVDRDTKLTESEAAQSLEMMSRQRTESTCSESDVAVEGHQIVKKRSRRTRVYQTSCRICKEVFQNVMLLKSHMFVHNTVETHLYECHICRHRFTQSCSLLRHLKTSCQENRMKCVPCGRTFHRRNTFEQHMRLHQGGPAGLDESFYDNRPDETEVVEARESDIENNNLAKAEQNLASVNQDNINASLQSDLLKTLGKNIMVEISTSKPDENESDSDARTYLYSEGEVHSRYNSDCSDTEWTPPPSPKKICTAQDLSVSNGANTAMTLNLLSAICSDIREAEKEQELKRKEMEEKQKELETIEILANLKRGVIQKTINSSSTVADLLQITSAGMIPKGMPAAKSSERKIPSEKSAKLGRKSSLPPSDKRGFPNSEERNEQIPSTSGSNKVDSPHKSSSSLTTQNSAQNIPSVIESIPVRSEPKIPVTVLEVAAEADRRRKERGEKIRQEMPASVSTTADSNLMHHSVQNQMSQMKTHYPAIEERLSLLMKAQLTTSSQGIPPSPSVISHKLTDQYGMFPQMPAHLPFQEPVSAAASSTKPSRYTSDDMPQDLSVKRLSLDSRLATFSSRSRTFSADLSRSLPVDEKRMPDPPRYITADMQRSLEIAAELQRSLSQERSSTKNRKSSPVEAVTSAAGCELQRSDSSRSLPVDISRSRTDSTGPEMAWHKAADLSRPSSIDCSRSVKSEQRLLDLAMWSKETMFKYESSDMLSSNFSEKPSAGSRSGENCSGMSRTQHIDTKRSNNAAVAPPPLVPMFQCELCSRSLYNKTDLQLHMMEHGRSAGALYEMLRRGVAPPHLLPPVQAADKPLDFTGVSNRRMDTPPRGSRPTPVQSTSKPTPPTSLDLSGKKSNSMSKAFHPATSAILDLSPGSQSEPTTVLSTLKDALSPVACSDFSDSLSSPSTPSGPGTSIANVDALRQELRLKIFSRRRSQGLDDLKVEFKTPEPTEMSEAEKLKLLYRRECNRQAAQRSRMRKKDLVDSLLEELHKEEVVHSDLRRKMEALAAQKSTLLKALESHKCVKEPNQSVKSGNIENIAGPSSVSGCVKLLNKFQKKEHAPGMDLVKHKGSSDISANEACKTPRLVTGSSANCKTQGSDKNLDDSQNNQEPNHIFMDVKESLNELVDKCVKNETKETKYSQIHFQITSNPLINSEEQGTVHMPRSIQSNSVPDVEKMCRDIVQGVIESVTAIPDTTTAKKTNISSSPSTFLNSSAKVQDSNSELTVKSDHQELESLNLEETIKEKEKELSENDVMAEPLVKDCNELKEEIKKVSAENTSETREVTQETRLLDKIILREVEEPYKADGSEKQIQKLENSLIQKMNKQSVERTSVQNDSIATQAESKQVTDEFEDERKSNETLLTDKALEKRNTTKNKDSKSEEQFTVKTQSDKSDTKNSAEEKSPRKESKGKSVKERRHSRHSKDEDSPIYKLLTSKGDGNSLKVVIRKSSPGRSAEEN